MNKEKRLDFAPMSELRNVLWGRHIVVDNAIRVDLRERLGFRHEIWPLRRDLTVLLVEGIIEDAAD